MLSGKVVIIPCVAPTHCYSAARPAAQLYPPELCSRGGTASLYLPAPWRTCRARAAGPRCSPRSRAAPRTRSAQCQYSPVQGGEEHLAAWAVAQSAEPVHEGGVLGGEAGLVPLPGGQPVHLYSTVHTVQVRDSGGTCVTGGLLSR